MIDDFRFSFIFVIECIGVISFAVSATIVAIRKRLDFIGAVVFALVTSFGGGFFRDLVIGVTPPRLLSSREFGILALICIGVSLLLFHLSFLGQIAPKLIAHIHSPWIELTDSIGLAAFCVLGVDSAIVSCPESADNALLLLFCGCITGVGGGIVRDIFSAEIPGIFRKHIYLIPALVGTLTYIALLPFERQVLSHLIAMAVILCIRTLAIRFKWNCPTPLGREKQTEKEKENEPLSAGKK